MKNVIKIFRKGVNFNLVRVEKSYLVNFQSSIEKRLFIDTHQLGTYEILGFGNCASEFRYIIIDNDSEFVLNPDSALPFYSCLDLIDHYL